MLIKARFIKYQSILKAHIAYLVKKLLQQNVRKKFNELCETNSMSAKTETSEKKMLER